MAKASKTSKWMLKGTHVIGCNCDWGCPCNFNARPTMGFCAGVWGWRIDEGKFDQVNLSGLNIAQAAKWPGAIHEGGGTLMNFIDNGANAAQRKALTTIMTGAAGDGGPFLIFASMSSRLLGPRFEEVRLVTDKQNPRVEIASYAKAVLEPIRNPVTNEKAAIQITHPTGGFIWDQADVLNAVECRISDPELCFTFPYKNGHLAAYAYKSAAA